MLLLVKKMEILPLLFLEVQEHAPFEHMTEEAEGTRWVFSEDTKACSGVKSSNMNTNTLNLVFLFLFLSSLFSHRAHVLVLPFTFAALLLC